MSRWAMKAIAVLLVLVTVSLTIQSTTATARYSKVCSSPECHLEEWATRKPLTMEAGPGDDAGGDDYDVYGKYESVPSPGVGH
ncbi:hypothetical protein RGQ29_029385 [Quercus rubra]|uniref:Uncharacterized protein n=1 Tax=Quercus rubra TaxID=3512 RepID=A0AAN7EUR5_QUERU|nr:hypothetical protein RGQ29_029385 [Quercus rubra]